MHFLINETTYDTCTQKILFPTLQHIEDLNIQFKEKFDTILLLDYQQGIIDENAYFSKISFIHQDKLFVFTEYENPENQSYELMIYNENNFHQCPNNDTQDFFIESRNYYYQLKYPETFVKKRIKI